MQETSKWIVKMSDGREYLLSEAELNALHKAIEEGKRMVRFTDFTINPSFVERIDRVKEPRTPPLPNVQPDPLASEKLREIKRRVFGIGKVKE